MSLNKCNAIVLSTVKYSDTSIIVKCFTDKFGLQSYIISGAKSKNAVIKPSQLQALTILELEAYHKETHGLQRIKEAKCNPSLSNLHFSIVKSSLALFISEILTRCIKEENQPDLNFFNFLYNAIQIIDLETGNLANFSCFFLVQLTKYLGFSPIHENEEINDSYITTMPSSFRNKYLTLLHHATFADYFSIQINKSDRDQLINQLLQLFEMQVANFGTLKSYAILKEVFN